MRILILFLPILIFASCAKLEPTEVESYYDVDSLVNAQYEVLKLSGYRVFKMTKVNGREDTTFIRPDSAQWNYELGVFRKANINKPLLRGEYSTDATSENGEGDKVVTYTPKNPDERTVRLLKVRYQQNTITELHAEVKEGNPVYGSTRYLRMYFEGAGDKNRLIRYEVQGAQKMVMKDSVTLSVQTEILYD